MMYVLTLVAILMSIFAIPAKAQGNLVEITLLYPVGKAVNLSGIEVIATNLETGDVRKVLTGGDEGRAHFIDLPNGFYDFSTSFKSETEFPYRFFCRINNFQVTGNHALVSQCKSFLSIFFPYV